MDHFSHTQSKLQKRLLLLWATTILWIYIGNIINFHQHHIWGKQLIPVACTSNRSKEKSIIKYQGVSSYLSNAAGNPFILENCIHSSLLVYGNAAALHFSFSNLFLSSGVHLGTPLRAPPVV